jgi:hypothetical protein
VGFEGRDWRARLRASAVRRVRLHRGGEAATGLLHAPFRRAFSPSVDGRAHATFDALCAQMIAR